MRFGDIDPLGYMMTDLDAALAAGNNELVPVFEAGNSV